MQTNDLPVCFTFLFMLNCTDFGRCLIHVSQESVEAKRKLNRGMTNQIQRWHVVSTESMASWLPERKHTKYPGTNRGNCIGWIGLGSQADEWTMTYGQKTFGNGNHMITFWFLSQSHSIGAPSFHFVIDH